MAERFLYIRTGYEGILSMVREWIPFVALALVAPVLATYLYLRLTAEPRRCEPEEHAFLGRPYDVRLCYMGGNDLHDKMRLRVYSKDRELLAQREFVFLREIPVNYVEYRDAAIVFSDAYPDGDQRAPAKRVLKMPPTKSDWWRANLDRVLLNP